MANVRNGNTFYVDTASSSATTTSYIEAKNIKLKGLLFTNNASGDEITVNDLSPTSTAAGSVKLRVDVGTATDSKYLDFASSPINFPNGIWVSAISASSSATFIIEESSG